MTMRIVSVCIAPAYNTFFSAENKYLVRGRSPMARALRETVIETDRFSINRKPTDGRFLKSQFSVFPILVGFGFRLLYIS
jgi:hypothetical protein